MEVLRKLQGELLCVFLGRGLPQVVIGEVSSGGIVTTQVQCYERKP